MRMVLILIAGLVLVVTTTLIWRPSIQALGNRGPIANARGAAGPRPVDGQREYAASARQNIRRDALRTLDRPWSAYCTPDGHRELIEAISNYYFQRVAEAGSKADTYSEQARRFAIEAWQTTDHRRIERLIGESHGRGYFALNELQPYARKTLDARVKGTQLTARPCAS
jgi:hypothetical protein